MKRIIWMLILSSCAAAVLLVWHVQRRPRPTGVPTPPAREVNRTKPPVASGTQTNLALRQPSTNALRPALAAALGQAQERDFRTRLRAISQLGSHLPADEREVLYQHLRESSEDKWLRPGQGLAIKNDILNLLCEQEETPAEFVAFLTALWRDAAQPIPMRDYALQHFAPLFPRARPDQQGRIIKELQTAAAQTAESYAGTALLTLSRIQQENPSVQIPALTEPIKQVAGNPAANLLTRIAALQLAGELNFQEGARTVERVALDQTEASTLRLAAVAAVGRLAAPEAAATLQRVRQESADQRLQLAAVSALERLNTIKP